MYNTWNDFLICQSVGRIDRCQYGIQFHAAATEPKTRYDQIISPGVGQYLRGRLGIFLQNLAKIVIQ